MVASFNYLADPRLPEVSQADYDEQFRVAAAIRDTINQVYDGIRQAVSIRGQVESASERAEEIGVGDQVTPLADTITTRLTDVQREMTQTENQSNQDPIRFAPMLDNRYVALYEYVTGEDSYRFGGPEGRPSDGAYDLFNTLNVEWVSVRASLERVLQEDVARFNDLLQRLGVPGVTIPGRLPAPIP